MSKKGACSPPSKRRRKYSEVTFAQYRMNEFLDWMMLATEEEKDWVTSYLLRGYIVVNQSRRWEWLVYGECLEFIGGDREIVFQFDRLGRVEHHHTYKIVDTLWLKKQDATLYENAPIDFWILVAQRLADPDSLFAFSLVSKKHYRVARMDIVYEKWNRLYLKRDNFYSNPFSHLPSWKQFLIFLGIPKDEVWIEWTKQSPEYLFFIIVRSGGLGYLPTPADAIFDLQTKTIRRANGTRFFWIENDGRWMIEGKDRIRKEISWGYKWIMEHVMK